MGLTSTDPTAAQARPLTPFARPTLPDTLRWFAGIDGGGTGTRVKLADAEGCVCGQGQAGASSLSQGVESAWREVRRALGAACAAAGDPGAHPASIALGLGLAGAGVAAQREAFLAADPGFAFIVLDNDALTQLVGAHGGGPGIVVAAGTGTVALARYADGSCRQAGGWGFPVGDEGGGAWLGLHAMAHAHAVLDGRAEAGALSQAVFAQAGGDAQALLAWCAQARQAAYATLAPRVFQAAEAGDPQAELLLQAAAEHLARLAQALQAPAEPLPVVMRGSIGERLLPRWPATLRAQVVPAAGDSADGALQLLREALAKR